MRYEDKMITAPMTVPVRMLFPLPNISGFAPPIISMIPPTATRIGAMMKSAMDIRSESAFSRVCTRSSRLVQGLGCDPFTGICGELGM